MTIHLPSPEKASLWCLNQRKDGKSIGYVPTMGALHEGHLSLVRRAKSENTVVCVSIFVNPLQFNNPSDLEKYPRNLSKDIEILKTERCDMVYTGKLSEFFPEATDISQIKSQSESLITKGLEGEFRPGHLEGVWTIVERLFTTVGNCKAYFGEKDFQQTLLIRDLAKQMGVRQASMIDIITCPTVRETSGLAISSRNQRLTKQQKEQAVLIYQTLVKIKRAWKSGLRAPEKLETLMLEHLQGSEISVEYATVRDPDRWSENLPHWELTQAQALIAGLVGEIRLIDNLLLND